MQQINKKNQIFVFFYWISVKKCDILSIVVEQKFSFLGADMSIKKLPTLKFGTGE